MKADKKDSFIFYRSFFESLNVLNDEDKLSLFNAICELALNQTVTEMKPLPNAMFMLMKPQIVANNRKFENGKKGGRPKQEETKQKPKANLKETKAKPKANLEETKPKPNVNVNVNVNDNVNENVNENSNAIITKKFSDDSFRLSDYLYRKILSKNQAFKKPNLNAWAIDIDKALRLDKRTVSQLKDCIDWIYTEAGSFWQPNVLSGKKLREKFDTMNMQVISKPKSNQSMMDDIYDKGLTATEIIKEMEKRA